LKSGRVLALLGGLLLSLTLTAPPAPAHAQLLGGQNGENEASASAEQGPPPTEIDIDPAPKRSKWPALVIGAVLAAGIGVASVMSSKRSYHD